MNPIKFFFSNLFIYIIRLFSGSFKPASFAAKSRLNTSRAISWWNRDLPKHFLNFAICI